MFNNPQLAQDKLMEQIQNISPDELNAISDMMGHKVSKEELMNMSQKSSPLLGSLTGSLTGEGLMQNPQNLVTGQTLTQNYNSATTHSPTIVNNNFNEGSVQADARNMSAKDVQAMFTGAFGYNKARGTKGILG